jgi:spore germination protein KA
MEEQRLNAIKEQLAGSVDVVYQRVMVHGHPCSLIYIPSIVNPQTLREGIAAPLLSEEVIGRSWSEFCAKVTEGTVFSLPLQSVADISRASDLVTSGYTLLYLPGVAEYYSFDIAHYQKRSVSESQNELVIIGPQEAFIEDVHSNLSLLRHKIKHPDLKMAHYTIGKYTKTDVYVLYIDGLHKPAILEEVDSKLKAISIDGILGISYLREFLQPPLRSPFPLFQDTERPDSLAASLLDGRIGILVDGNPSALLMPVTFFSLLQSSEDYYQTAIASSWIRLIRFAFSILSMLLPSLYVAITTFHPQIIPSNLLVTIAAARENLPFSALTEALIMELTFEALREAGTRIPKPLGQTVSIIGAIVIGQAAVQAGIVSAPMVIVVSITGIASYIIPHLELSFIFRLLRFPLLIIGGTIGLIGVFAASFVIYGHLASLRSYGTPYLQPIAPMVLQDWKDTLIRVPFPWMTRRSTAYTTRKGRRQKQK